MVIIILSITIITFIVWLIKNKYKLEVCPICAGVLLTWLWLLVGMKLNLLSTTNYELLAGILMGGTVVGLMTKLEKHIKPRFVLWWKTIFVLAGFTAVYSLLSSQWMYFIIDLVVVSICTFVCTIKKGKVLQEPFVGEESNELKKAEDKLKNCC